MPPRTETHSFPNPAVGRGPRQGLRPRIILLTVFPLLLATFAALVLVQEQVSRKMRERLRAELEMAHAVSQKVIITRQEDLRVRAQIIARDPKFFALLTIPPEERTPEYGPSIYGMAEEFAAATGADLLDILDERGAVLAWAGEAAAPPEDGPPDADVEKALQGGSAVGVWVRSGQLFQVASLPIFAGGKQVGVIRYGKLINQGFAERIRSLARTEVDFRVNGNLLVTTGNGEGGPAITREIPVPGMHGEDRASLQLRQSLVPMQEFLTSVRWALATLGFVFTLLALGVANWVANRITRPIDQLLRASAHLERGDYEAPVEVHTGDELEALASTFESMRQSLRRQITTLAELDQMKSDFIGLASHELRTPVSVLHSCIELLSVDPPPSMREGGDHHDLLEGLQDSTRRLTHVVDQVTDMSLLDRREMKLAMRPIDLMDVLRAAAEKRREDCRSRKHSLEVVNVTGGELPIWADPERLNQVVDSLLLNAIRYTEDGGKLILRGRLEGEKVVCEVQDNGMGMETEILDRIFEPFFEGKEIHLHSSGTVEFNSGGLGTGLAITRRIVEAHSGEIVVESRPGEGSLFRVIFPRHEISQLESAPEEFATC